MLAGRARANKAADKAAAEVGPAPPAEVKGPPTQSFSFFGLPVGGVDTGSFTHRGVGALTPRAYTAAAVLLLVLWTRSDSSALLSPYDVNQSVHHRCPLGLTPFYAGV